MVAFWHGFLDAFACFVATALFTNFNNRWLLLLERWFSPSIEGTLLCTLLVVYQWILLLGDLEIVDDTITLSIESRIVLMVDEFDPSG